MSIVAGLLPIMVNVVMPVFLIAAVGFTARRTLAIDPRPFARVSLYVFVPALLFNSLLTTTAGGEELLRMGIFVLLLGAALLVIGFAGARLYGASPQEASGLTTAITFSNAANLGLPVNLFAFGPEGFDRAAVFFVFENLLMLTVGVFVAARGKLPWRRALLAVVQMPALWAAGAALVLRATGVELPLVLQRSVSLLSSGAVPTVILLLGMQLAGMRLAGLRPPALGACAVRLLVSPAIGLALVTLLQPAALTGKVLVLQSAMPTAVNVAVIAAEFDADPDLVSSIVLLSTAFSLLTVTAWVAYLQTL